MHFLCKDQVPDGAPVPQFDVHASPNCLSDDAVVQIKSQVPFYWVNDEFHYNGHKTYPTGIMTLIHYAQVQWEMLCTDRTKAYLIIVTPFHGATSFTVKKDIEWLVQAIKWLVWRYEHYVSGANLQRLLSTENAVY